MVAVVTGIIKEANLELRTGVKKHDNIVKVLTEILKKVGLVLVELEIVVILISYRQAACGGYREAR